MPPRLESAPKKRVRRKPAPKVAPRDAIYQRPKPKVVRPVPSRSIGQNAPPAPKVPQRPKPKVISDVSSTGGYDVHRAVQFRQEARKATGQARKGKPFDPYYLRGAINTGIAPDVHEGKAGVFFVKQRRKLLPDVEKPVQPQTGAIKTLTKRNVGALEARQAQVGPTAPALKVLEATATPLHAIAGTVAGKGPGYGIKHKTTFGSILRKHKVPGAGALGFAADVALDPTTYVSFGTGSIARKAALDAAKQTTEHYALVAEREATKASRRGGTEAQIARRADRARADVLREGEAQAKAAARRATVLHKPGSGVTASFAGREAPGVTRATAAAGRTVKKVAAKSPKIVRKGGSFGRELASELRPTLTPPGVNAETYVAARQGARSSRSFVHQHIAKADARARGLRDKIGEEDYAQVVDALERGRIGKLPDHLHQPAIALRSAYRHANRLRKRAGVSEGTVTKRPKTVVPSVTADVEASRKTLNKAQRARTSAESEHRGVLQQFGIARGRAAVLSRNVGGRKAEVTSERETRRLERRMLKRKLEGAPHLEALEAQMVKLPAHDPRRLDLAGELALEKASLMESRNAAGRVGPKLTEDELSLADTHQEYQRALRSIQSLRAREATTEGAGHAGELLRARLADLEEHAAKLRGHRDQLAKFVENFGGVRMAGGGLGVAEAHNALRASEQKVRDAREAEQTAQAAHEGTVVEARQQRVAHRRAVKQQKSREGEAIGYHPHAQQKPLLEGLGIVDRAEESPQFSGTLRRPGSSKKRSDKRPISEQNPVRVEAGQEPYSTDIPLVHINYERGTAKAVAAGRLEQSLAATGRELKPKLVRATKKAAGKTKTIVRREYTEPDLKAGEAVYHLGYSGKASPLMLREIKKDDWTKGEIPTHGKFVVLDRKTVEAARQYGRPTQAQSAFGRGLDRATRGFKMTATATPGFHVRNLIGDTQLAYLSQPGHKLPLNLYEARKAVSGLNAQHRATEKLVHDTTSDRTIRVAGEKMPVDDFLKLAREHGIPQSGYLTGELRDLGGTAVREGVGKKGRIRTATSKAGRVVFQNRAVKALTQDRENLVRLSTFKHGLDSGLKPGEAADVAMGTHIDYADLTEFERRYARRLMPFYTFSARALPFQAKKLVTRPGKFANLEKAREEIGGTDVSGLSDYQQRQVPVLVNGKGVTMGLPVNLLNEIPTSTKPGAYGDEIGQFLAALANPVLKAGPELYANKNFTFRDEIQPPDRPLVSAPDWVSIIPESQRKKLGIVQGPDHRTGQRVWKWPGKLDYKVRSVMVGPLNQVNALSTSGANRIGQGQEAKALAGLTGVRVSPTDKTTQAINRLYQKRATLTEQRAALGQQGFNAKHPNAAYRKVHDQIAGLNRQIYTLSKQRGDKSLPRVGGPRKVRRRSGPLGSGGLGGGGLGRGGLGRGGL